MTLTSLTLTPHKTIVSPTSNTATTSSSPSERATLESILKLEEIDPLLYRGYSPAIPRYGRVFGGQTVAQSLVAAVKTVDSRFRLHSLHCYFMRPGNDDIPILYQVEITRDGQSFCTRRVLGLQQGKSIFTCDLSFHISEPGLRHQYIMPKLPHPDQLTDWNTVRNKYKDDERLLKTFRNTISALAEAPFQMGIRKVHPVDLSDYFTKQSTYSYWYVKSNDKLPNDDRLHFGALAYMSDAAFLEVCNLPHATYWAQAGANKKPVLMVTSIDHAMWLHTSFRADEWLLYECTTPITTNGRGLVHGRFYNLDGQLVASTTQECLMKVLQWDDIEDGGQTIPTIAQLSQSKL